MKKTTQGKRTYPTIENITFPKEGEYYKHPKTGDWHANAPGNHYGNLKNHTVTELEDGTITVAPSILITYQHPTTKQDVVEWHGYLEKGVWREV